MSFVDGVSHGFAAGPHWPSEQSWSCECFSILFRRIGGLCQKGKYCRKREQARNNEDYDSNEEMWRRWRKRFKVPVVEKKKGRKTADKDPVVQMRWTRNRWGIRNVLLCSSMSISQQYMLWMIKISLRFCLPFFSALNISFALLFTDVHWQYVKCFLKV